MRDTRKRMPPRTPSAIAPTGVVRVDEDEEDESVLGLVVVVVPVAGGTEDEDVEDEDEVDVGCEPASISSKLETKRWSDKFAFSSSFLRDQSERTCTVHSRN